MIKEIIKAIKADYLTYEIGLKVSYSYMIKDNTISEEVTKREFTFSFENISGKKNQPLEPAFRFMRIIDDLF